MANFVDTRLLISCIQLTTEVEGSQNSVYRTTTSGDHRK